MDWQVFAAITIFSQGNHSGNAIMTTYIKKPKIKGQIGMLQVRSEMEYIPTRVLKQVTNKYKIQ